VVPPLLVSDTTSTPLEATPELPRRSLRVCANTPNTNDHFINSFIGDAHSAAADIKGHLPGRTANAEGELRGAGAAAGQKIDQVVCLSPHNLTILVANPYRRPLRPIARLVSSRATSRRLPRTQRLRP